MNCEGRARSRRTWTRTASNALSAKYSKKPERFVRRPTLLTTDQIVNAARQEHDARQAFDAYLASRPAGWFARPIEDDAEAWRLLSARVDAARAHADAIIASYGFAS